MKTKIRIAVQKSGRLNEDSMKLLKAAGIKVDTGMKTLKASATNFPLEVFFLRNSDIPQYVQDGIADLGIVGENVVIEKNKKIDVVDELGFSKCRLSIAIPKGDKYNSIKDLDGKKIATSYAHTLSKFLKKNKVKAEIHEISGSVEIAPGIGMADAVCDLVSTGSTLHTNGLKEVEVMLKSQAVLIATKKLAKDKQEILDKLLFRFKAVKTAKNNKYILLNAPNKNIKAICKVLPGMKSPTILPLVEKDWSSIHTVVDEGDFWNVIDKLKDLGAEGILVVPIEKMIL
jgi:ATP phosphoribosyltransferase